jgi:hypothetical protein
MTVHESSISVTTSYEYVVLWFVLVESWSSIAPKQTLALPQTQNKCAFGAISARFVRGPLVHEVTRLMTCAKNAFAVTRVGQVGIAVRLANASSYRGVLD